MSGVEKRRRQCCDAGGRGGRGREFEEARRMRKQKKAEAGAVKLMMQADEETAWAGRM